MTGSTLSPLQEFRAADRLMKARLAGEALQDLDVDLRPRTMEEAYRIQSLFRDQWCAKTGDTVIGWKIGATASVIQEKFGVSTPFAGPFFASTIEHLKGQFIAAKFQHLIIESEFAFRVATVIGPRAKPYTRDEVMEKVDAVIPAIEVVSPRFQDLLFGRAPTAVADCALNGAFVFGTPYLNWRALNLPAFPVVLRVNDQIAAEGKGAAVLGDPITSLVWAIHHLSEQNITVDAGQIISTGTTTGIVKLDVGDIAVADFGDLGTVQVQFT
jgi:2-keto-4-pentenoate hydratase